jgi:hypothetical protein
MAPENVTERRRRNWHLWAGFFLCLIAIPTYPFVFARFPITRDIPWVNFLFFGTGLGLLFCGLKRAFGQPQRYRGKTAGSISALFSVSALSLFCFLIFQTRHLPASAGAPRIGQKAPEFVLTDINNQPVSLTSLLSTPLAHSSAPAKGVLLVFYRGYW